MVPPPGTKAGSDRNTTDGIVDGHAYAVITSVSQVAGTNLDLVKVRNPHGRGEFEAGAWSDKGEGWRLHPEVAAELKPTVAGELQGRFGCQH
jgi:hypothetical protein